jgi:hypothetical protein
MLTIDMGGSYPNKLTKFKLSKSVKSLSRTRFQLWGVEIMVRHQRKHSEKYKLFI